MFEIFATLAIGLLVLAANGLNIRSASEPEFHELAKGKQSLIFPDYN